MNNIIAIGKRYKDMNCLSLAPWSGLAWCDVELHLSQYNLSANISKECSSRLSWHLGKDSNTALPTLYDLFNNKWKPVSLQIGSQWKIELDMNNYQRYTAKKDYHVLLEKTNYGIEVNAHYNIFSIERAHEAQRNTPQYEDTITMHIVEQSKQSLDEILSLPKHEILVVEQKEIEMLEYLISALPKP